jgi:hypothetical protein
MVIVDVALEPLADLQQLAIARPEVADERTKPVPECFRRDAGAGQGFAHEEVVQDLRDLKAAGFNPLHAFALPASSFSEAGERTGPSRGCLSLALRPRRGPRQSRRPLAKKPSLPPAAPYKTRTPPHFLTRAARCGLRRRSFRHE